MAGNHQRFGRGTLLLGAVLALIFALAALAATAQAGFHPSPTSEYRPELPPSSMGATSAISDESGALIVSTLAGPVYRFGPGGRTVLVNPEEGYPQDLATGGDSSLLMLIDDGVLQYSSGGELIRRWGKRSVKGSMPEMASGFSVAPDGTAFVADNRGGRILRFGPAGEYLGSWNGSRGGRKKLREPYDVAASPDGSVYVTDQRRGVVRRFTPQGKQIGHFGRYGWWDGEFGSVDRIATDAEGRVFVTDYSMNRIQAFDSEGRYLGQYGRGGGGKSGFWYMSNLSVAPDGRVLILDGGRVVSLTFDDLPSAPRAAISAWTLDWNRSARPGRTVTVPFRLVNFGDSRAEGVRYCLPRRDFDRGLFAARKRCKDLGALGVGMRRDFRIRVRVPKGSNPELSIDFGAFIRSANAGDVEVPSQVWVETGRRGR